jgi:hypothetical protein
MARPLNTLRGGHYATVLQGPLGQPLVQQVAGVAVSESVEMITLQTPRGLPEGRIVHLEPSDNKWHTGAGNSLDTPLPCILIGTSQYDKDVDVSVSHLNPLTQSGELSAYFNGAPTGPVVAVPVSAGYLFATTEYDPTQSYPVNTPLTASDMDAGPSAWSTGGVLRPAAIATEHVVGVTIPSQRTGANPELYDQYYPNGMKLLWFAGYLRWKG